MDRPDFVTIDAFGRPPGGRLRWRRELARAIANDLDGLRGASVLLEGAGASPIVTPGEEAIEAKEQEQELLKQIEHFR